MGKCTLLTSTGFLHPLIHLGFGLEFKQPVIVAEALAETAVHDRWLAPFFIGAEKSAKESKTSKTLSQLVEDVDSDEKLKASAKWVCPAVSFEARH